MRLGPAVVVFAEGNRSAKGGPVAVMAMAARRP